MICHFINGVWWMQKAIRTPFLQTKQRRHARRCCNHIMPLPPSCNVPTKVVNSNHHNVHHYWSDVETIADAFVIALLLIEE